MSGEKRRELAEILRDEPIVRPRLLALLEGAPKTIPELAAELAAPSSEVTLWVMAMRRYGLIEELPKPKADDYFRYKRAR